MTETYHDPGETQSTVREEHGTAKEARLNADDQISKFPGDEIALMMFLSTRWKSISNQSLHRDTRNVRVHWRAPWKVEGDLLSFSRHPTKQYAVIEPCPK